MRWILAAVLAVVATIALPSAAQAERRMNSEQQVSIESMFATAPVGDSVLSEMRAGRAPFAALTIGTATRLADSQAREDFRQTGSVGRITMDVWWGSTGSELIATSVRAAGRP